MRYSLKCLNCYKNFKHTLANQEFVWYTSLMIGNRGDMPFFR